MVIHGLLHLEYSWINGYWSTVNQHNGLKIYSVSWITYLKINGVKLLEKQNELLAKQLAAALIIQQTNKDDPAQFAYSNLRILNKDKKLVPLKWNKAQSHFHSKRTGRDLILKARQLGFTTYIQGELFRREIKSTRTSITLAHDADTTSKIRLMADRFWENYYSNGERVSRKYANASMTTYPKHDTVATIATAGSLHAGRGDTYTDLHGSEVAFWPDAESIIAGAMQGGQPDVILESTPNGAQGYFYELCMESLSGNGVWKNHFYPWWWDESYRIRSVNGERLQLTDEEKELARQNNLDSEQIRWRRNKQAELKHLFKQEYPEDPITCFLTSGNSYFGDLSNVFTAPMNVEYDPDHRYFAGLDFGQSSDFTAMPVLDLTTKCQVDLLHINKLAWSEQRRRIVEMYKKWHIERLGAESNSIGSVNIEALSNDKLNIQPFVTNNESKAFIMSNLYEAIHSNGWKLQPYPVERHEMQIFTSVQLPSGIWRLAADGEGHDDTVIGLGIGLYTCTVPMQIF